MARDEKKPLGYWRHLENCMAEANTAMRREGWKTLPGSDALYECGYQMLVFAAGKYHGGMTELRKHLGQEALKREPGIWRSLEYTLQQIQDAMRKQGWLTLPHTGALYEQGYGGIADAIKKYHGGMRRFRDLIGQEQLKREEGAWKDLAYAIQQARGAMQKEGWAILPGNDLLNKYGYSALVNGIRKHHGGMRKFRKHLQQRSSIYGAWTDIAYTIKQARIAMREEGWVQLPSPTTLKEKGYRSLANAIHRHHGGFRAFRHALTPPRLNGQQGRNSAKESLEHLLRKYAEQTSTTFKNIQQVTVP